MRMTKAVFKSWRLGLSFFIKEPVPRRVKLIAGIRDIINCEKLKYVF